MLRYGPARRGWARHGQQRQAEAWSGRARHGDFMSKTLDRIVPPSNGATTFIEMTAPYVAKVTIEGTAALLFHAWNNESVEAKSKAAKNSRAKKTDDVESYVYRTPGGLLGLPGANFHASLVEAARYLQDPRSSRKSGRDLAKAALI